MFDLGLLKKGAIGVLIAIACIIIVGVIFLVNGIIGKNKNRKKRK